MIIGSLLGLYIPLQLRQRNYDCASRLFAFCVEIVDWNKLYNSDWDNTAVTWIMTVFKGVRDIWMFISTVGVCVN